MHYASVKTKFGRSRGDRKQDLLQKSPRTQEESVANEFGHAEVRHLPKNGMA